MHTDEFTILLDRLLPEALEPLLRRILGTTMPRLGEGERYKVTSAGRFNGRLIGDLLAQAHNQAVDGALLLVEDDVFRVLYFERGEIIAADSSVLFERLGRILGQAGVLEAHDAAEIADDEERAGLAVAARRLPADTAAWGLERRIREIVCGLYLMSWAHFVFVDGSPDLGEVPTCILSPMELAVEGMRRYDEWRNRTQRVDSGDETLSLLREALG